MSRPKIGEESQIERRLRLRDLRIFSAVAEHRSMAKAAAALGVARRPYRRSFRISNTTIG